MDKEYNQLEIKKDMKHLIRIDYVCDRVKTGGSWYIIETEKIPNLGIVNTEPFAGGPMQRHGCKNYYYSDNCDMDGSCNWQRIEELKPYSEEEAKVLQAKTLESLSAQPSEVFVG